MNYLTFAIDFDYSFRKHTGEQLIVNSQFDVYF